MSFGAQLIRTKQMQMTVSTSRHAIEKKGKKTNNKLVAKTSLISAIEAN